MRIVWVMAFVILMFYARYIILYMEGLVIRFATTTKRDTDRLPQVTLLSIARWSSDMSLQAS